MILLEGDVRLVSKKNGQLIRIEAQRVMLNMNDGTFTVESGANPQRSHFGVLRTSHEQPTQVAPHGCPFSQTIGRGTTGSFEVLLVWRRTPGWHWKRSRRYPRPSRP
jgi:hypothetical protein